MPIAFIDLDGLEPAEPGTTIGQTERTVNNQNGKKENFMWDGKTWTHTAIEGKADRETDNTPSRKDMPSTSAFNSWVQNSFDRRMGISQNQWENPYLTEKERESNRRHAQTVAETAEGIGETFVFLLENTVTFGGGGGSLRAYKLSRGVMSEAEQQVAFSTYKKLRGIEPGKAFITNIVETVGGKVVTQPVFIEFEHVFLTQRLQRAWNLPHWLVNLWLSKTL